MANRDVVVLNEQASRLEVAQVGDTYNMPADVNVQGNVSSTGTVTANAVATTGNTANPGEVACTALRLPGGTVTAPGGITPQSLSNALTNGASADLAVLNQPAFELTSNGRQLFSIDQQRGLAGMLGNIASPLVDLPLDQIELMPFAAATASAAIPAATDVAGWAGLLRTVTVTFAAVPDGVAAGQYAIINGEQYPITATTATTVTLEYSALLADPTGMPVVQFALWRFAGKYRGLSNYSRASRRTYIDPLTGQVTGAPAGFPALERMADGGIGLLLEGSSTNLAIYSEQFDNGTWQKIGGTITANTTATTAPDGSNNADLLVEDTTTGNHYIRRSIGTTVGQPHTASIYVKPAGRSFFAVVTFDGATWRSTYFDLTNQIIGTNQHDSAKIDSLGNGWYRLSATINAVASTQVDNYFQLMSSLTTTNYTGDGTSGVYLWGAQLEALPFASSYIPTTTTTATRARDSLYIPVSGNSPHYTQRSVVCDFDVLGLNIYNFIFSIKGNTSPNNRFLTHTLQDGRIQNYDGVSLYTAPATVKANTTYRLGITSNKTTFVDGALLASSNPNPSANQNINGPINLGANESDAYQLYGHIRNFRIYDRALSSAEIAAA